MHVTIELRFADRPGRAPRWRTVRATHTIKRHRVGHALHYWAPVVWPEEHARAMASLWGVQYRLRPATPPKPPPAPGRLLCLPLMPDRCPFA